MNDRIAYVKKRMNEDGLAGYVVSKGSDIKYLTGFTGEYGVAVVLLTEKKDYFITDGRFTHQAAEETEGLEVVGYRPGAGYFGETKIVVEECGLTRCGFMGAAITHGDYLALTAGMEQIFIEAGAYIAERRRVKTSDELAIIKRACNISERSFYGLLDRIKPGMTEIDLANELEYQFRSRGGSGFCFDTIVASGPDNGADCHATPSSRKLVNGDLMTLDFGTYYQGYCSDITRTVAIGEPKNEALLRIYDTVKLAKREGEKLLKPGLCLSDLYRTINQVIVDAGHVLPHGPGHGFGLDIHEDPFITANSVYCMEQGVVHTLEPGIYVPGVGGVRIEDDYVITEDGYERLTNITEELMIIYS